MTSNSSSNMFRNNRNGSGNIDASNNIFNNNNRTNYNNRYSILDESNEVPQNIFRQQHNSSSNNYNESRNRYNSNRNMFNNNRPAPVVKEPEIKSFPPIDDFPTLGLSSKTKAPEAVPPVVKSFAKIAEDASVIVVPKPAIKKTKNYEDKSTGTHKQYISSGKPRMTLDEFMERREDGQQIDMDDVSICSEYSNNIIDDSDDDYDYDDN